MEGGAFGQLIFRLTNTVKWSIFQYEPREVVVRMALSGDIKVRSIVALDELWGLGLVPNF